jgi:hypothetical protein
MISAIATTIVIAAIVGMQPCLVPGVPTIKLMIAIHPLIIRIRAPCRDAGGPTFA